VFIDWINYYIITLTYVIKKLKLSLCAQWRRMGTRLTAPLILKLCTGLMWVTSFTRRPHYQNEKWPITQWTGGHVNPSATRWALKKRKTSCWKSTHEPSVIQSAVLSVQWLRRRGFLIIQNPPTNISLHFTTQVTYKFITQSCRVIVLIGRLPAEFLSRTFHCNEDIQL
jgi:hypothetical protein